MNNFPTFENMTPKRSELRYVSSNPIDNETEQYSRWSLWDLIILERNDEREQGNQDLYHNIIFKEPLIFENLLLPRTNTGTLCDNRYALIKRKIQTEAAVSNRYSTSLSVIDFTRWSSKYIE